MFNSAWQNFFKAVVVLWLPASLMCPCPKHHCQLNTQEVFYVFISHCLLKAPNSKYSSASVLMLLPDGHHLTANSKLQLTGLCHWSWLYSLRTDTEKHHVIVIFTSPCIAMTCVFTSCLLAMAASSGFQPLCHNIFLYPNDIHLSWTHFFIHKDISSTMKEERVC
jgi:hypothetical protein